MTMVTSTLRQGRRFAAVGVLNTLVGYGVIFSALLLGASDYLANGLGYGVGLALGFVLHRSWSFADRGRGSPNSLPRYVAAFALAYGTNLAVVWISRRMGWVDQPGTHIVAMAAYSVTFFLLAKNFVFQGPNSASSIGTISLLVASLRTNFWLLAGLAIWAVGYALIVMAFPLTHDVVWQLWIGERLHNGSRLYVDIMEINPPLWFWIAEFAATLAKIFSVSIKAVLVSTIVGWTGLAALLIHRLLRGLPGRTWFVGYFIAAVSVYSFRYFGQREHLALLAAVPYAILIARRRLLMPVPFWLAVMTTIAAAFGFALKHYFVVIPALLEIWLLFGSHGSRKRLWLRPETIVLGVGAFSYALAVLICTPDFFTPKPQNPIPLMIILESV